MTAALPLAATVPEDWRLPDRGVVGMWCLIIAESAIFTIFVVAYIYYLGKNLSGPEPRDVLELPLFISLCLWASSGTSEMAVRALRRGEERTFTLLWLATIVLALVFMVAAPALVLVGAPIVPLLLGLPRWAARDALGPFLAFAPLRRFGHALTHPVIGWLALSLAMIGWHLPGPYQLALRSTSWHEVEHLCFFTGGLLFWWPVVQPWPTRAHWPAWSLPPYLLLGDLVNTGLAALLAFSDRVLYPAYETAPRLFGLSASADQVLAAALMPLAAMSQRST